MKMVKIFVPMKYGVNVDGLEFGIEKLGTHQGNLEGFHIKVEKKDVFVDEKKKYIETISSTAEEIAKITYECMQNNHFPLTIGGDHSVSIGSLSGIGSLIEDLGVIWIDAHGDMNTPDISPSGNIHGMVLSSLQGLGDDRLTEILFKKNKLKAENIVLFGIRDLDDDETKLISQMNIKCITYDEILNNGLDKSLKDIVEYLKDKTNKIHISFDLDSLNPDFFPGVSTPVKNGFKERDAMDIMNFLFESFNVVSGDIVEFNPKYDKDNTTLNFLIKLINHIHGKVILL